MDVREIVRRRLRNHRLTGAIPADPAAVVAWFGAMQAQEFAVAKWSIGQRATGLDDAAVQHAFDEGQILRTHALRPTWHFVAAADLRWIQALTGLRVHGFNGYYNRVHGLDDDTAQRMTTVVVDALRGATFLTRAEIGSVLADAGLPAAGGRLAYVVMRTELEGLVASGPMRGRHHTYALVEERAPVQTRLDGDAALAELTRRYFTSRGPATVKDFAWWSSLTQARIRHGIGLLGDELTSVDVDGLRYWFTESTTVDTGSATDGSTVPPAHVLQPYDEYVIAYAESRGVMNSAGTPLFDDRMTVYPVILAGQLAGLWRREVGRGGITAHLRLHRPLTARQRRDVEAAFARYATFAATPVHVSVH